MIISGTWISFSGEQNSYLKDKLKNSPQTNKQKEITWSGLPESQNLEINYQLKDIKVNMKSMEF